jgi:hypothetical protein
MSEERYRCIKGCDLKGFLCSRKFALGLLLSGIVFLCFLAPGLTVLAEEASVTNLSIRAAGKRISAISNPYADVKWETYEVHLGNFPRARPANATLCMKVVTR